MALINIQTNLKSLTYGEFGTEPPLVTKPIDGSASSSGLDLEANKRIDDLTRITKLITSTPAALKFGINQAALNTLEQRIKSNADRIKNKGNNGSLVGDALRGVGNSAKVFASTIAQVPVNGTGTHFVKGFAGKLGYLRGVQGHIEYKNNRKQDGTITVKGKIEKSGDFAENKSLIVLDYFNKPEGGESRAERFRNQTILQGTGTKVPEIEGSFAKIDDQGYIPLERSGTSRETSTRETNTNHSELINTDAGFDYTDGQAVDKINTLFGGKLKASSPVTSSIEESQTIDTDTDKVFNDLIKFRFKIISPQTTEGGEPTVTHLNFRAYLDSFGDNYSSNWNSFKYIGRAEDFYTYSGFSRNIDFSFKVAVLSKNEVDPLYQKLNKLVGQLAPTYVGDSFMRGNFAAVTIGDYLLNQTGFFNSINLSWNTDYQFGGQDGDSQLPHVLDVQCSFQPVHNFNTTFGQQYINKVGNILI